jgi:hypothetical protein
VSVCVDEYKAKVRGPRNTYPVKEPRRSLREVAKHVVEQLSACLQRRVVPENDVQESAQRARSKDDEEYEKPGFHILRRRWKSVQRIRDSAKDVEDFTTGSLLFVSLAPFRDKQL